MPPNNAPHNALTAAINAAIARGEPPVAERPVKRIIAMSFDADGSVEFTRNKNLDTFFGGAGRMKRVTDIQKLEHGSQFFIKWLMGPYAGRAHTVDDHIAVFGPSKVAWDCRIDDNTRTLLFFSYEFAVQYEILCLNAMREKGITFDHGTQEA